MRFSSICSGCMPLQLSTLRDLEVKLEQQRMGERGKAGAAAEKEGAW